MKIKIKMKELMIKYAPILIALTALADTQVALEQAGYEVVNLLK